MRDSPLEDDIFQRTERASDSFDSLRVALLFLSCDLRADS